jgi:orotate phosphoribosyltransferase
MYITKKMIKHDLDFLNFDIGLIQREIANGNIIPQTEIIRWLTILDAYWSFDYQGDPTRPHALLTSGNHSDGFADCLQILSYPKVSNILAFQLHKLLYEAFGFFNCVYDPISWVIGSPHAGITFSYDVANFFHARHGATEKGPDGKGKNWRGLPIKPGENVLLVEELITTMKTASEQQSAIFTTTSEPVCFVPFLGVFFNRSGQKRYNDQWPIISVIEQYIANWKPEECPLCKKGSQAIRPKKNWKQLTEH